MSRKLIYQIKGDSKVYKISEEVFCIMFNLYNNKIRLEGLLV